MTIVGIPLAFATCVLIALAALLFNLLCIGAAAATCALVYYILKGTWWTIRRIPYWVDDLKILRAKRKLMNLPLAHAHGSQMEQWNGKARCIQRSVEMVPQGYMPGPGELQSPPRVQMSSVEKKVLAGPATKLPEMI